MHVQETHWLLGSGASQIYLQQLELFLAYFCLIAAQHHLQYSDLHVAQGGKGSLVKCFVERIVEDATEGDLKCPECGSEFARPAMIRGKPANKIIGGKVIMRK